MSFVQRQLRFTFSGEKVGTLSVKGLRAIANVQAYIGKAGVAAQLCVWGMKLEQMNAYSSARPAGVGIEEFSVAIEAGDIDAPLYKIVDAAIWRSFLDLEGAPDSAFNVTVAGTLYKGAKTIAAQSHAGSQPAETLIQSICNASGLTLHNNGAHNVLRNHATYGSAIDQIVDIARAAQFKVSFFGNNVYIWPETGNRDDVTVDVGPDTGMVGYPRWWEMGLIVTTRFNREIQVGRQVRVTSSIPKANGVWSAMQVNHELGTMFDNAPWFTTAVLV